MGLLLSLRFTMFRGDLEDTGKMLALLPLRGDSDIHSFDSLQGTI